MVGGHDDQRLVPQPLGLQALPELLQLEVGEAGLEEVALEQHVELPGVLVGLVRQRRGPRRSAGAGTSGRRAGTATARAASACA